METLATERPKEKDKTQRDKQTFYRVAFKNNCNLLQIADNKANIIITINSLLLSSTIAILGYGSVSHLLQIDSFLTVAPILIFLGTILTSTTIAVQAAKPSIINDESKKGLLSNSSLLFFGESAKYTMEEYLEETRKLLGEKAIIYDQMSISLYFQGKVLNRKYKLLRKAYEIFIIGLALGILIFTGYLVL